MLELKCKMGTYIVSAGLVKDQAEATRKIKELKKLDKITGTHWEYELVPAPNFHWHHKLPSYIVPNDDDTGYVIVED